MTVAAPNVDAVTSPLPLTVATEVGLLAQVMTLPLIGAPLASKTVAVNCTVPPTGTVAAAGLTLIEDKKLRISWRLHAATTQTPTRNTFLSRANRRDNLCLNVMATP